MKYDEILRLFQVSEPVGYSPGEMEKAKAAVGAIPEELEEFLLRYGNSSELHGLQDELILPGQYKALLDPDYIIFFNENQGVCQAAVRKADTHIPDPPVYTSCDSGEWKLSSPHVSEFLIAMFGYQASICLPFSPEEFYWITPEEKAKIEKMFTKREQIISYWLYDWKITLYGDNDEGRLAIMENGGDIQMQYAANTENEYERMSELLDGIGEEM